MAEVRCPICFQLITLECDISATPCAHLFHTICIKHNYQEKGRFVCYQCESNAIWFARNSEFQFDKNIELKEISKIDFKTADEINTFTERMKKIDSDTWINFKENGKIVEEKMQGMMSYVHAGHTQADQAQAGHAQAGHAQAGHAQAGHAQCIDFDKLRVQARRAKGIDYDFEELQVQARRAKFCHTQEGYAQAVRESFECNGKTVEEKRQGMISYAHAGHTQADQAQAGHVLEGHAQEGYPPENHDNLKIASKENCKAFEERMSNMKISDEKNPDQIILYGNTYAKIPNGQGYKLVTQSNKRGTESEAIRLR